MTSYRWVCTSPGVHRLEGVVRFHGAVFCIASDHWQWQVEWVCGQRGCQGRSESERAARLQVERRCVPPQSKRGHQVER